MTAKVSKLQKEKDFLAQTSDSLLRNQDDFRTQLAAEQAAARSKDEQIKDLTDQVRPDLLVSHNYCCQDGLLLSCQPDSVLRLKIFDLSLGSLWPRGRLALLPR